jgi:hypothetical protein
MAGEVGICPLPVLRKQLQPMLPSNVPCWYHRDFKHLGSMLVLHFFVEASSEWTEPLTEVSVHEVSVVMIASHFHFPSSN